MKAIPLSQGKEARVDDDDFEALNKHRWHANKVPGGRFYAARKVVVGGRYTILYMHHAIVGKFPGKSVDHMDGDPLNNQRANLRVGSQSENCINSSQGRKPGVFYCKLTGRYAARTAVEGKRVFLGRHDTFEEAADVVAKFRAARFPLQRATD